MKRRAQPVAFDGCQNTRAGSVSQPASLWVRVQSSPLLSQCVIASFTRVRLLYQQFAIVVLAARRVALRTRFSRHGGAAEFSCNRLWLSHDA
jgi:hypothetical protein